MNIKKKDESGSVSADSREKHGMIGMAREAEVINCSSPKRRRSGEVEKRIASFLRADRGENLTNAIHHSARVSQEVLLLSLNGLNEEEISLINWERKNTRGETLAESVIKRYPGLVMLLSSKYSLPRNKDLSDMLERLRKGEDPKKLKILYPSKDMYIDAARAIINSITFDSEIKAKVAKLCENSSEEKKSRKELLESIIESIKVGFSPERIDSISFIHGLFKEREEDRKLKTEELIAILNALIEAGLDLGEFNAGIRLGLIPLWRKAELWGYSKGVVALLGKPASVAA